MPTGHAPLKEVEAKKAKDAIAETTTENGRVTLYGANTVKEVCEHLEYDPLKALVDLAKDPKNKPELKLEIASMLLPYLYGHTTEDPLSTGIPGGGMGIFIGRRADLN